MPDPAVIRANAERIDYTVPRLHRIVPVDLDATPKRCLAASPPLKSHEVDELCGTLGGPIEFVVLDSDLHRNRTAVLRLIEEHFPVPAEDKIVNNRTVVKEIPKLSADPAEVFLAEAGSALSDGLLRIVRLLGFTMAEAFEMGTPRLDFEPGEGCIRVVMVWPGPDNWYQIDRLSDRLAWPALLVAAACLGMDVRRIAERQVGEAKIAFRNGAVTVHATATPTDSCPHFVMEFERDLN